MVKSTALDNVAGEYSGQSTPLSVWHRAAAKRTHRTVDAAPMIIDAVERAEMASEHDQLDHLLK